jgi:hypothetical protein
MQSFSRDPLPGDGGHPRTTAVSVADLLGGVIEGQVSGRPVVRREIGHGQEWVRSSNTTSAFENGKIGQKMAFAFRQ